MSWVVSLLGWGIAGLNNEWIQNGGAMCSEWVQKTRRNTGQEVGVKCFVENRREEALM